MKLSGALVVLGVVLLLTSGGNCGICPAIKEDIEIFLDQSVTDYVNFIKQYKEDTATLKNAEKLKKCADDKFTEEDKESIKSLLKKIEASIAC
ncbi:major allergen I polypeptide chain 1-like [Peromyscus maniculatus bairdii]|uniref:Major allergen I polypeptide chain 1-like n=1 Tax=Peromyscus maniculatus bairdii TaxID=230844 RepID=A0A6I9LJG1_PERMB|nr:major allergen I polypeptide chain 1-like [Peromyscus maniculatus bairdii]